ncbi:MAG: NAD(P)H-quinone oxidoreductase [Gemmatimonadetes bacterium]|nr:NAD(P)H-quinone oxidoreductase [Gemmatimonadota bacterium]
MRAVVYDGAGDASVVHVRDEPRPVPVAGQVRVRVRASALNRADVLQRAGRYPPPAGAPQHIPGLEFAGEIDLLGCNESPWRVGDRVLGLADGGAHAEYLCVPWSHCAAIPAALTFIEAAAVPEAFITAHDALVTQGGLGEGSRAIVTACGSGVGTAGVQLARALRAVAFGTSRTAAKLERARALGLDAGVTIGDDPAALSAAVRDWSGGTGADVAMDLLGGAYAGACLQAMAPRGRVIVVGLLAGAELPLSLGLLLSRRLTIRGTVLRSRSVTEKANAVAAFVRDVVPLFEAGKVKPVVHSVRPFAEIRAAHAAMEAGEPFGKLVLAW